MTWREIAAPIIAEIIAEHGPDGPGLRQALIDAYPFGERSMWPYKAWLAEIKRQREAARPKPPPDMTGTLFDKE